jgi:hypothetical protein
VKEGFFPAKNPAAPKCEHAKLLFVCGFGNAPMKKAPNNLCYLEGLSDPNKLPFGDFEFFCVPIK